MTVQTVADIGVSVAFDTEYDLAFFASGYEDRACFLARQIGLHRHRIQQPVVLAFSEQVHHPQRVANDRYFSQHWNPRWLELSADDEGPLYGFLKDTAPRGKRRLHFLVDYSSMSRLWYAGILNWARYAEGPREIVVDFFYSVGEYVDYTGQFIISDILAIPGCEGGAISRSKLVAVFGLGFDNLAALCVLDRLQPDQVYGYLADPAASPDYAVRAREANDELIHRHATTTLELPLSSVETTFRYLAELVVSHRTEADITIIPMGPKPHILAAILLAMRFEDITCLRVSGKRQPVPTVMPLGRFIGTRLLLTIKD
jgi:hypothetical protein